MSGWRSSRTIVIGTSVVIFAICCILPVAYLVTNSLTGINAAAAALFLDARQRTLLYNATLLGVGATVLAAAIGAPLGIALARVPLKRKAAIRVVLAAPMLLPPYMVALAWVYLWTSGGILAAHVDGVVASWTYSLPAAILVLSLVFYPLSTTVYVTHDREDASALADSIVEMRAGRIVSISETKQKEPG